MRTPLLATLFGLSLVACAGQIDGGGGDDDIPVTCGDGTIDTGETCDDGNNIDGDGCSAACTTESNIPLVNLTVDKPTVTTDLGVENTIMVTVTGSGGFTGDVTLAVTALDATSTPFTGWSTTLGVSTVTLAENGTQTVELKLLVPGDHDLLSGTVNVSATSTAAIAETTVGVTANPVLDVVFTDDGAGNCVYPQHQINNPHKLKADRNIMVYNGATAGTMTIHVQNVTGFTHENTGTAQAPGEAYGSSPSIPLPNPNDPIEFYCHNGGAGTLRDVGLHNFVQIVP